MENMGSTKKTKRLLLLLHSKVEVVKAHHKIYHGNWLCDVLENFINVLGCIFMLTNDGAASIFLMGLMQMPRRLSR